MYKRQLQNRAVQKIVTFFSIIGLFVMGVMAAENVSVALGLNVPYGGEFLSLQETLIDGIAPGLLSLCAVFGIYKYLQDVYKRQMLFIIVLMSTT